MVVNSTKFHEKTKHIEVECDFLSDVVTNMIISTIFHEGLGGWLIFNFIFRVEHNLRLVLENVLVLWVRVLGITY